MTDSQARTVCKACGRVLKYVEDEVGGDWVCVVPWGKFKRRSCKAGYPPYYGHAIPGIIESEGRTQDLPS